MTYCMFFCSSRASFQCFISRRIIHNSSDHLGRSLRTERRNLGLSRQLSPGHLQQFELLTGIPAIWQNVQSDGSRCRAVLFVFCDSTDSTRMGENRLCSGVHHKQPWATAAALRATNQPQPGSEWTDHVQLDAWQRWLCSAQVCFTPNKLFAHLGFW